ncbi:MAG: twin-arginine translocase TatA/TatE family subunit [Acidobacteria bacterium]|uniref:Sec-independent protein translocase protein TatA n=1 Tax=Candidatus Polarisedimenticola svalbardensis TaxID=2886004 RepID=A0A8J7CDH5_9BACT|nr:twin-arginine translocase TatA/TatE family subunit [Candidatus Polarisedimenticola svalbardensis]
MSFLGFLGPLGLPEILVILAVILLLFGGRKIPELARGLGEGIKNFRSSVKDDPTDQKNDDDGNSSGGSGK